MDDESEESSFSVPEERPREKPLIVSSDWKFPKGAPPTRASENPGSGEGDFPLPIWEGSGKLL